MTFCPPQQFPLPPAATAAGASGNEAIVETTMKNETVTASARPSRKGGRVIRASTAATAPATVGKPSPSRRPRRSKKDLARLNAHPLNQHALKLLPHWALRPQPEQLHLLTLASPARFATEAEHDLLARMETEWPPAKVLDYFTHVEAFDDLFLAQERPLEATQVILAAVDLVAEPGGKPGKAIGTADNMDSADAEILT